MLKNDGIFISESHYLFSVISGYQFDTIYHEHLRYYSLNSINHLMNKIKMEVIDFELISTHGGSIRVYSAKRGKYKVSSKVKKHLKKERSILNLNKIRNYGKELNEKRSQMLNLLNNLNHKKVYAVGAPSRSTTLINFFGLNKNQIKGILEIKGSHKIGKIAPGSNIEIIEENKINLSKIDFLIFFSWHIYKDLAKIFIKKGYRGKFIIPLPKPKIVDGKKIFK